jgi:hypothetical protein
MPTAVWLFVLASALQRFKACTADHLMLQQLLKSGCSYSVSILSLLVYHLLLLAG